jgi:hypothetical protein
MSAWVPHAIAAAFVFGVAIGMCISWGADRAELAAYRRISRMASERAVGQVDE